MLLEPLTAVSSVDGRYRATAAALAGHFSEYALIKNRLVVECAYLRLLSSARDVDMMRTFTDQEVELLRGLADISIEDAHIVKMIEREGYEGIPATNHDVKAVEYFMKLKLKGTSLEDVLEELDTGVRERYPFEVDQLTLLELHIDDRALVAHNYNLSVLVLLLDRQSRL